ncbi:MAG: hypothetical protein Q8P46_09655 [Hyphomicrobiales bacterium]|nr:hypothetical protein [Hyphomicrobiales bacterium]
MSDNDFEREKVCYEQNFEQARSLNSQMNQVPVLAMTLTGGLWFAAGVTENLYSEIRFGLLLFAGFCNIALILAALRIRDVFHSYLDRIRQFRPDSFASGKPEDPKVPQLGDYSMITIYCALMAIGSVLSFVGALGFYWPFGFGRWIGIVALAAVLAALYLTLFKRRKKAGAG